MLLLAEPIDEWLMGQLREYNEHPLVDITRGELDLAELGDAEDLKSNEELQEENKALVERLAGVLQADVSAVRTTQRLTNSPACLVLGEYDIGEQMRKIMAASGQSVPESKPVLEINPAHPLIERLAAETADDRFADLGRLLFDQAALAEGRQLADPGAFVQRMNRLLVELAA